MKLLLCSVIFLFLAILCKRDNSFRDKVYSSFYQEHFSFSYFKNFYDVYFKGIFPIDRVKRNSSQLVFGEGIQYSDISSYLDGALLKVDSNYLIANQKEGVVVFVGKKDGYGDVVIISGLDNVDRWYGNLCHISVKLYDYVLKDDYLGESCDDTLYLAFYQNNKFLDYHNYLF